MGNGFVNHEEPLHRQFAYCKQKQGICSDYSRLAGPWLDEFAALAQVNRLSETGTLLRNRIHISMHLLCQRII